MCESNRNNELYTLIYTHKNRPVFSGDINQKSCTISQLQAVMDSNARVYTFDEVARHNHTKDCWLIISGYVYDVTSFLAEHPGGDELLLLAVEKDATMDFRSVGHSESAQALMKKFRVGKIDMSTLPGKQEYVEPGTSKATPALFSLSPSHILLPLLLFALAFAFPYFTIKG